MSHTFILNKALLSSVLTAAHVRSSILSLGRRPGISFPWQDGCMTPADEYEPRPDAAPPGSFMNHFSGKYSGRPARSRRGLCSPTLGSCEEDIQRMSLNLALALWGIGSPWSHRAPIE